MVLEAKARLLRRDCEAGYAMAALLVTMAVMAVLMTVALPTWKQSVQREKEEELIFRGTQYARAIGAYQRKYANASPPTLDVLIEQHFLRKKYKDPMALTEDGDFALLYVANQLPTGGAQGAQSGSASAGLLASTEKSGNIIGVASKNPAESIRSYNNHNHYNEWQFMALVQTTRAGGAGGAGQGPGVSQGTGPGGSTFTPAGGGTGLGGRGGPGGRGQDGTQQGGRGPQGGGAGPQSGGGRGR
jgi:type II secretory pathway pseudopilin PulG